MTSVPVKVINSVLSGLGRFSLMVAEVVRSLTTQRLSGRDLLDQLYFIGVKSQTVVLVTGAFTGMVLCAQTYFQFHKVKMDSATLAVVSVSMCGELGPVLTALMVAGPRRRFDGGGIGNDARDGANRCAAHAGDASD